MQDTLITPTKQKNLRLQPMNAIHLRIMAAEQDISQAEWLNAAIERAWAERDEARLEKEEE